MNNTKLSYDQNSFFCFSLDLDQLVLKKIGGVNLFFILGKLLLSTLRMRMDKRSLHASQTLSPTNSPFSHQTPPLSLYFPHAPSLLLCSGRRFFFFPSLRRSQPHRPAMEQGGSAARRMGRLASHLLPPTSQARTSTSPHSIFFSLLRRSGSIRPDARTQLESRGEEILFDHWILRPPILVSWGVLDSVGGWGCILDVLCMLSAVSVLLVNIGFARNHMFGRLGKLALLIYSETPLNHMFADHKLAPLTSTSMLSYYHTSRSTSQHLAIQETKNYGRILLPGDCIR